MTKLVIKRLLILIPILLLISLVTFILTNLAAGDPASIMLRVDNGPQSEEAMKIVRKEWGLDKPLPVQYKNWLIKAVHLDFGNSYQSKRPAWEELSSRFPATLRLGLCAMIFLLAIALPWGILSAIYPDSWLDDVGRAFSFVSVSTPAFWMGLVFLYFFGVKLSWVPVVGNGQGLQIILPALTMALGRSGTCIRLLRTTMLDVLNSGYIRAARAKGLRERLVISRHALKNAILPVVTRLGGILGAFLGGSAIMETVFSWPGVGKYALESILYKDIPVIQGYVLFMAAMVVVINLFVDVIYMYIDPHIRIQ